MSADLPEGVDATDARRHALTLSILGNLVNLTSKHLNAEEGSAAEDEAETELDEFVERVTSLGPEAAGLALLTFASLVAQVGDEATVQAWFDHQAQQVAPFLTPEERGE